MPLRLANTNRDDSYRGPVPGALGALLAPVYGMAVARRNAAFDRGRGVERVGAPVISIGNLSTGGTGKSPMVLWTIERLRAMGKDPGVATRGYKAKRGELGDEQREMLQRMPDLAIEADPVRVDAARRLIERGCDVVVLDDGFQHRKLARELDVILIDATRPAHRDYLLPRGYLREARGSLRRAHAVVITRCDLAGGEVVEQIAADAQSINPGIVVARSEHRWADADIDSVRGRPVVLACGIGNPGAFEAGAVRAGARVVRRVIKADHYDWSARDAHRLAQSCDGAALLTTAKDWTKLAKHLGGGGAPIEVLVPRLSIRMTHGEQELLALIERASGGDG